MTEARPGWTYQGLHLRIYENLPAAAYAYVELVRSAKADGTLIQHRAPGMSVDLIDGRTIKFISRANAEYVRGFAIASFELAPGVELNDQARRALLVASARPPHPMGE
jgi:hypothetical protein